MGISPASSTVFDRSDRFDWSTLIDRYDRLLRRIAREHGLSVEQGADVSQTTWLRLLLNADRIRNLDGIGSWLAVTATRECRALIHRQSREIPTADSFEISVHDQPVDPEPARRAAQLRQAVAQLPGRERDLMVMLLEEDAVTYATIVARLGMPIGSIGPVRRRALNRLRAHLEERGVTGT